MALQVPSTVSFITVDTTSPKTLQLPLTTNRIGRILTIKDRTGLAATNPITIQTQGGDTFQNAVTSYVIDVPFGSATFVARSGQWILQQGTQNIQASSINARFYFGDGSSLTNLPAISSLSLLSTVTGLGSANYVSTLSLISTTNSIGVAISSFSTAFGPGGIALSNITSTVAGLGSAGYVSSASLLNLVSTPNLLNLVSTQGLSTTLYSTINSLATVGYVSSTQLTSTVRGLGTAGYASTSFVGASISSLSSIYASTFGTQNANISSLTTSSIFFGVGDGYLSMPDIQPFTVSTLLINTSSILAVNPIVGNVSTLNALRFWGLTGALNNTAIAEVSTGAGTQELLFFKGSSVSDQIRFQTTGIIEFETGVSSRLWPNAPQNPTPAMIINTSSNVGIQTANPGTTLDVNGTARAITLSSQQLFVSSINGAAPINSSFIQSTIIGLGSVGYVSTLSLISTTLGLQQSGFVSSPNLLNLVSTPNLLNLVSTQNLLGLVSTPNLLNLVSTPNLLNLVSTQNLLGLVSTPNLLNLVSTPNLLNLVSTQNLLNLVSTPNLLNLVSTQGLSTTLYSTITSLASFGYISSLQLLSTTRGSDNQLISTAAGLTLTISTFVDPNELASTVIGLGSAGFISSIALDARLASTTMGLGSAGYVSTASLVSTTLFFQTAGFVSSPNLLNLVSTPNLLNLVSTPNLLNLVSTPNLLNLVSTQGLSTTLYSTITSLASFGYISTSQLVSTTLGLQTAGFLSSPNLLNLVSTTYLSTVLYSTITNLGSFGYMSSVVSSFLTLSTGTQTTSTTRYIDTLNTNSTYNIYVRSTFLYFNNYIVAGVTQLQPQIFNF